MDTSDVVALVLEQVDAYNARDTERTLAYYAPNAAIVDGNGTVLADGREAIRAAYTQVFARNPTLRAEVPTIFHVGEWVVLHSIVPSWAMNDGSHQEMQWIEVFRVVGGKIHQVRLFH